MTTRRERGFSLIEMLVAFTILLIGLAISVEVVRRAHDLLASAGRDLHAPPMGAILLRLRTDIQGAETVGLPLVELGEWTEEPLQLGSSDGVVAYFFDGESLTRTTFDGEGKSIGSLVLARSDRGLDSFQWRALGPELIEVAIDSRTEPGARGVHGLRSRHDALRGALRGAPRRWGW